MTEIIDSEPILGITHLLVDGELRPLLKCPFCNSLRNIHVEEIEHHIRFTHPERSYRVSDFYPKGRISRPYGAGKAARKGPWIKCLWCNYKDKGEFDLSLHVLEEHKKKLLQIPISSKARKHTKALSGDFFARFESSIEFRLDVAVEMAKEENRELGVKHAIKLIQKRTLERRRAREQQQNNVSLGEHYQRIAEIVDSHPELVKNGECDLPNCSCHWVASLKKRSEEVSS